MLELVTEPRLLAPPAAAILLFIGLRSWPGRERYLATGDPLWPLVGFFALCWGVFTALWLADSWAPIRGICLWASYIGIWIGSLLVVWSIWVGYMKRAPKNLGARRRCLLSLPAAGFIISFAFVALLGSDLGTGALGNSLVLNLTAPLIFVANGLFVAVWFIGRRSLFVSGGKATVFLTELELWLEVKLPEALKIPLPPEERLLRTMELEREKWDLREAGEAWDLYDLDRGFRWTYPPPGGPDEDDYSVLPFDPAQGLGQAEIILVVGPEHSKKTTMIRGVLKNIMTRNVARLGEFVGRATSSESEASGMGAGTRGLAGPIVHCDIVERIPEMAGADDLLGVIRASVRRLSEREVPGSALVIVYALSNPKKGQQSGWWSSADIRRLLGHLILDGELARLAPSIVFEVDMDPSRRVFDEVAHLLRSQVGSLRDLVERVEEVHRIVRGPDDPEGGHSYREEAGHLWRNPNWILRLFTTEVGSEGGIVMRDSSTGDDRSLESA